MAIRRAAELLRQARRAVAFTCLAAGELESLILPLEESLAVMRLLDQLRAEWGLRYPGE